MTKKLYKNSLSRKKTLRLTSVDTIEFRHPPKNKIKMNNFTIQNQNSIPKNQISECKFGNQIHRKCSNTFRINLLYDSYSMTMISHRHLVNTWKQIRKSADSPEPYPFITLCLECVATRITR